MGLPLEEVVEALRTSLKENERLRQENEQLVSSALSPVAVVGMGGRFRGGVWSRVGCGEVGGGGVDVVG